MLLFKSFGYQFFTLWKFEEIKAISHSEIKEMEEAVSLTQEKEKFCIFADIFFLHHL